METLQKLVFFEGIVDANAFKTNEQLTKEITALGKYVFGEADYQVEEMDNDDFQIWCGDQLDKALRGEYGSVFRFKGQWTIKKDGYQGPVVGWFLEPDGALDDQIVVLTCESNGLFNNPRYVVGVLMASHDMEYIIRTL